jgi:phospholipase/carboxylesterase
LGYSDGANIAATMMQLHPGILAGTVLLRPTRPVASTAPADLTGKPVLIVAGEEDSLTTPELTHDLAATLSRAGARVDVKWIAAGHELTPYDFQTVHAFFKSVNR